MRINASTFWKGFLMSTNNQFVVSTLLAAAKHGTDSVVAFFSVDDPGDAGHADVRLVCSKQDKKLGRVTVEVFGHGQIIGGSLYAWSSDSPSCLKRERGRYRPGSGCWSLTGVQRQLVALLATLPKTAVVSLEVHLDHGTNQYLEHATTTAAGQPEHALHADALHLVVRRTLHNGETERRAYMLDYSVVPHNSARFGVTR
jgi:hypothetical protein